MTHAETLSNPARRLPTVGGAPVLSGAEGPLGVLSIHFEGGPCRVGCEFCYLGARVADEAAARPLAPKLLEEILSRLDYAEVAVALSEPVARFRAPLRAVVHAATARGKPVAITTTAAVLHAEPWVVDGVARVNLSIDPRKGPVAPRFIDRVAAAVRAPGREVVLIVSLTSRAFADSLLDDGGRGLRALVELPHVDKVALNALKPPPEWCDRAFWLAACARLAPLLEAHLDRRLFLDCWVAARILGLGGCPARPDVSPGHEFRSCVYQTVADFRFADAADLAARLRDFVAPAHCPFPIR